MLRGQKRKHVEDDDDESKLRPQKRVKLQQTEELKPPVRRRDVLDAESFFGGNSNGDGPRYIGRSGMLAVREHIVKLSTRETAMMLEVKDLRRDFMTILISSMSLRRKVLQGLGHPSVNGDVREKAKLLLIKHKSHMIHNEEQLIKLEGIIPAHGMANRLASKACTELDEKLALWETSVNDPYLTLQDFPRILELVTRTGKGITLSKMKLKGGAEVLSLICGKNRIGSDVGGTNPSFALFSLLPTELRLQIWEMSLGERRIITHNPKHNKRLSLLAVSKESRNLVRSLLNAIITPKPITSRLAPQNSGGRTLFLYMNPDFDIVVRDMISREPIPRDISRVQNPSLFDLADTGFNSSVQSVLTGLSKIKNLALGFDIFKHNGGRLFPNLQACCPNLETLKIFPNSQLESDLRRPPNNRGYKFIDFDSNFRNLISFYKDRLPRGQKKAAIPAMEALLTLSNYTLQYRSAFPKYVTNFGQDGWSPTIRVCMVATWNDNYQGWQTGCMDLDYSPQGFHGRFLDHYYGFIESCVVCDRNGELFSRYDGIERLFKES